jgi:hypothetical protein
MLWWQWVWRRVGFGLEELIDYGHTRPANELRASKESTLKGTQTTSEPGLAGFPD